MGKPKYDTYLHKETGLKVKATPFKEGMEDGKLETGEFYITAFEGGYEQNLIVNTNSFIIFHKTYKFVFEKDWFLKTYKKEK